MTTKLSGMEMMLSSVFKAMGFDPAEVKANIETTVEGFKSGMTALQTRLNSIDENQARIMSDMARIKKELGIADEMPQDAVNKLPAPINGPQHKEE